MPSVAMAEVAKPETGEVRVGEESVTGVPPPSGTLSGTLSMGPLTPAAPDVGAPTVARALLARPSNEATRTANYAICLLRR